MGWMTRSWRPVTALTVMVLLSGTACGALADPENKLDPRIQRMVPTESPAPPVNPRSGQPAETRQVTGKYFSMYVPANFQERRTPASNGEEMVTMDAPSSKPARQVRVAVVPDTTPRATAIEQSYTLESVKESEGAKDFTRSALKWPGGQSAVLLQWTETSAGATATDGPRRHWQIMAQVNSHLIVSVVAFAPAGDFDTAGLAKVVETFRPHA
jgi:hypothetical protein